jgi:nucleotide-binding universal stress UspA family protein
LLGIDFLFRRILIAVDGSEHSYNALKVGIDLVKRYSAEVILLNVIKPYFEDPLFPPLNETTVDNIEDSHQKMLSKMANEVKTVNPDLKISKKLISGRPAETIVEFAEKQGVDLIVVGSRGLGGIKEFILGSVSDRVADQAHCPVLIVK